MAYIDDGMLRLVLLWEGSSIWIRAEKGVIHLERLPRQCCERWEYGQVTRRRGEEDRVLQLKILPEQCCKCWEGRHVMPARRRQNDSSSTRDCPTSLRELASSIRRTLNCYKQVSDAKQKIGQNLTTPATTRTLKSCPLQSKKLHLPSPMTAEASLRRT